MLRRRRWRSRPTAKASRKKVLLIVLLILVLFVVQSFMYVERNLRPPLMNLAKVRIKQIATEAINSAIADHVAKNANAEQLIDWKLDSNGKITGFMLNYAEHMRITGDTVNAVRGSLTISKAYRSTSRWGRR
ncbi:hypothetical protein [Paenibacillus hexagrammi]|uniref:Uncharacterized protein n=1 Tax=Paenibacillus hexagrammi TaxID=2908839 RepID=A0ABY3SFV6_9BACL|nr:hypothetical protein [Paenibacillus sp. YPD9-1]UJF32340.1 hypothetical protein L0M14_21930 [Paenibacillus sp. YPD9-1]